MRADHVAVRENESMNEDSTSLPLSLEFRTLNDSDAELAESPVYCAQSNAFWWVDCDRKRVHCTDLSSDQTQTFSCPEHVGFVVLTNTSFLAVGMQSGIFLLDPLSSKFEKLVPLAKQNMRFNDAYVDQKGTLWAGTQRLDTSLMGGSIYSIKADLNLDRRATGFTYPNGLAFDEKTKMLFFSDSHRFAQTVWTTNVNSKGDLFANATLFADFRSIRGRPDGAALDAYGRYWIAAVSGSCIHVFATDGTLLRSYETPFPDPTKIAFGGPNLSTVFLTAKQNGMNRSIAIAELSASHHAIGLKPNRWKLMV